MPFTPPFTALHKPISDDGVSGHGLPLPPEAPHEEGARVIASGLTVAEKLQRAAFGDDSAWDAETSAHALSQLRSYVRAHGTGPGLYQMFRLPAPGQRNKFALFERDAAYGRALELMPGRSARARREALVCAVDRFRALVMPAWRDFSGPPEGAAQLHVALWDLVRITDEHGLKDLGPRQIARVTQKPALMTQNSRDFQDGDADNEAQLTGDSD